MFKNFRTSFIFFNLGAFINNTFYVITKQGFWFSFVMIVTGAQLVSSSPLDADDDTDGTYVKLKSRRYFF